MAGVNFFASTSHKKNKKPTDAFSHIRNCTSTAQQTAYRMSKLPVTADTRPRMMSTTLDHQKGNKLWVHDAVPRNYSYHPFSTQVSGITPEGPALPTVAMINSARFSSGGSVGPIQQFGAGSSGAGGVQNDDDGRQRRRQGSRPETLVAGGRSVKTESHTLYHTPYYHNNGMC